MPSAPEIKRILRTAADWPVWIQQVNYLMISSNCKDYISINDTGDLELTPPKSPVRPNVGGPPDKRVRVPGDNGALQWPSDREYMEYLKSKNEYLGFILAVQRSIDPDVGFDVTQERSFGEIVEGLKAHLGVGRLPSTDVVSRSDPEESWYRLINQDLDGTSVRDWGEQIIKAYRSLKKSGSEGIIDWKAHIAFIVNVNKNYPNMSAALYVHLMGLQEKREKKGKSRKASFSRFVQFGATMIWRLEELPNIRESTPAKGCSPGTGLLEAAPITRGNSREASVNQSTPGLPKRQRLELESETPAKSARKKAKKSHETRGPHLTDATTKTPVSFFSGSNSDTLVPENLDRHHQEPMMSGALGLEGKGRGQVYATPDTLSLKGRGVQRTKTVASSSSKRTTNHDYREESSPKTNQDTPCGICNNKAHATPACGILTLYRMHGDNLRGVDDMTKGICKVWLDNERSTSDAPEARSEVSRQTTKQNRIADTKTTQETNSQSTKTDDPFAGAKTIQDSDHARRLATSTKDRPPTLPEIKTPAVARTHELECYICHGRSHATDACGSLEMYQKHGGSSKRKIPSAYAERCETWLRQKKPSAKTDGAGCRICRDRYHATEDCRILELYWEYGDKSMVTSGTKERCEAWLKERSDAWLRDTDGARDKQVPDVECSICQTNDHDTKVCGFLSHYQRYGANASMSNKTKERCRSWVQKAAGAVEIGDVKCSICENRHHSANECSVLARYKIYGEDAVMTERAKGRCCSWLRDAAGRAGDVQCAVCNTPDHPTTECSALEQYRRSGESARVPEYVKDRCRLQLQKDTASGVAEDAPCGVCPKNHTHSVSECWFIMAYQKLGEEARIPRHIKDRCRALLGDSGIGIKEGAAAPPPPLCSICRRAGHTEKGCRALRTYRTHGDDMRGLTQGVGERCKEWLERERREMQATLVKKDVTPRMSEGRK